MAVDANVLIFERIREEIKTKKGPARSIELGYEKALSAIIDANITTFITAVILFAMGSGPCKGFCSYPRSGNYYFSIHSDICNQTLNNCLV